MRKLLLSLLLVPLLLVVVLGFKGLLPGGDGVVARRKLATMQWERPDVAGWRTDAPQELRDPPDVR
ncbi:hypothetical protein OJ996_23415 [Luteolibacter sp. GHJ8]|uniref:Uncharacterized protein n=1 Tax=Luteolibacter rhizosphaerae TaxID=2989719 RepID=A0ABT3G9M8_9BACT|nr:hypothetical protein [Luteolibacter rhizosphaerae]MCW1916556.1 hypothetical protein [Luteolibacter rhizosphaerae]